MIAIKEPGFISDLEEKQARCLREECAWFVVLEDQGKEGCAIRAIAGPLPSKSSETETE
jgi:hypothetical protein